MIKCRSVKNIIKLIKAVIAVFVLSLLCSFHAHASELQNNTGVTTSPIVSESKPHFDRKYVNLNPGSSVKIRVRDYDGHIEFGVSNKKIATINYKGVIRGKKKGKCKLFATLDDGTKLVADINVGNKLRVNDCKLYGHRGDADNYTENTVKAFKSSVKKGYAGVELDVYLTDSGDFMVFHDLYLNRLCSKNITIYKVSKENRNDYPIVNGRGEKEVIPTLEECLTALKKVNTTVFIHIKRPVRFVKNDSVDECTRIIRKTGMSNNVVLFCWNDVLMEQFHQKGFEVGIDKEGWHRKRSVKDMVDTAVAKDIKYIMCLERKDINDIVVDYAHQNGRIIGLYMAKTMDDAQYVNDIGADFAICYKDFKK